MKKNRKKKFILAALTGLLIFTPVRGAYVPEAANAAQVSDTHDSKLSAFDIAPGTLSPAFSPDILEYTSTVDAGVTDVRVKAVPRASASGAVIASIEGRNGLHPGVNTIKVTCSAPDNTFTVYTITLIVGSADAGPRQAADAGGSQPEEGGADASQPEEGGADASRPQEGGTDTSRPEDTGTSQPDNSGQGGSQENGDADGKSKEKSDRASDMADTDSGSSEIVSRLMGKVAPDGSVTLNGAAYQVSDNFVYGATTQDIPSAFGQGSVQIGDNQYNTLYCETAGVHLVYMENKDGNGSTGFYYYDEKQNAVERFKYTGIGDNFVVFVSAARKEVPQGWQETSLELPSGKEAAAYQNLQAEDLNDYYLVYGMNSDGSSGWYLYDNAQGTYMRYADGFVQKVQEPEEEGEEVARTVSLAKYNSLNEKYTELKKNRVRIVSISAIALVVLIIIFTALLLRGRDDEEDDEEEAGRERSRTKRKSKKAKTKKKSDAISKSSLAAGRNFEGSTGKKSKKVTKTFTQEPVREQRTAGAAPYKDGVSTPEEIRAQVNSAQQTQTVYRKPQQRSLLKKEQASTQESVQLAAERMRQSVKYPQKGVKSQTADPMQEHGPMDDWDMEETVGRKSQKSSKSAKKKRGFAEEEIEIMDLNDL